MAGRRIDSNKLKALVEDHDGCPHIATSKGTGSLEQVRGTGERAMDWRVEFLCSTCKSTFLVYNVEFRDVMREVLAYNGINAK